MTKKFIIFIFFAEHGVVHTDEDGLGVGEWRGQGHSAFDELAGGIFEVELVEHAAAIVGCQGRPVAHAELAPLGGEAQQIGLVADVFGAEVTALLPHAASLDALLVAEHPQECLAHVVDIGDDGVAGFELLVAAEGVVHHIRPHYPLGTADGYDVDALPGLQVDGPVVVGHACDDVVGGECPSIAHAAVLYPDVAVVGRELTAHHGILQEDGGVRLDAVVEYLALVVDKVLDGQHGGDDLSGCAEVVELATGQREDGHAELLQLVVVEGGIGAEAAAEVGVEVVVADAHSVATIVSGAGIAGAFVGRELGLLHEQLDGTVAQQPNADVSQVEVVAQESVERLDGGFLQHTLQHRRVIACRYEDSMVLGSLGVQP